MQRPNTLIFGELWEEGEDGDDGGIGPFCLLYAFNRFILLTVSVLTTLERRFNLQSADVGVIASSFEIGNLALILFVSYFGAKAHRPRLIGCGGIVMALGALLSALPEFLTHQYEYEAGDSWHAEDGRDICSNKTRSENRDSGFNCGNRANTNMMYLLLIGAQVLLGIGATPVQPLGVSYIDDHGKTACGSFCEYFDLRGLCQQRHGVERREERAERAEKRENRGHMRLYSPYWSPPKPGAAFTKYKTMSPANSTRTCCAGGFCLM
ncbi:unnamed protein product [Menidia menidia]|uniref:(Atlantic silverside) hypothetical protein n=1 Tax=Menidia menidia TaxID=238744 RepID=A0A8S4AAD2_9TELE|nr:unnamed protein product [Menidia menidia]